METENKANKPQKISFRVSEVLLKLFSEELLTLPISRDLFLNNLIKTECEYLAADLHGKRLSNDAKDIISYHLKHIDKGTRQISVVIDTEVAARLNEIVATTNIVRDSFLNLVLYFLLLTETLRKRLELPEEIYLNSDRAISEGRNEILRDSIPMSPFKWLAQVLADPFRYLREELSRTTEEGAKLYLMLMPEKLLGFTCYAEDSFLPGTDIYKRINEELLNEAVKDF